MTSTVLQSHPNFRITRTGRYLSVQFLRPHAVLSTSQVNGGRRDDLTHIANHQSCEGGAKEIRGQLLHSLSAAEYHTFACKEAGLPSATTALLGTAANMEYASLRQVTHEDVSVLAIATGGVESNAARAGDPARWHEGRPGWKAVHAGAGTINILVLFDRPLNEAALARAVVTLTEAKTTVLEELGIGSRSSQGLATGTGTDQFAVASPLGDETPFTWTGQHSKLGEILGRSVHDAIAETLRWQNGLEPSRTRSAIHALRRFGLERDTLLRALQNPGPAEGCLPPNPDAVLHDPGVACSAWAIAGLLDRGRYGVFSKSSIDEAIRRECALTATAVSGQDCFFSQYLEELSGLEFPDNFTMAIQLGWRDKWKT